MVIMSAHEKQNYEELVDAVETLSEIADLNLENRVGLLLKQEAQKIISYKTVDWLQEEDPEKAVEVVKETFKTVLKHLKNFYKGETFVLADQKTVEGIKNIMVLVGEAAKKIDSYQHLFLNPPFHSITTSKEYRQFQEFYQKKISRTIDQGVLGRWILAITKDVWERKSVAAKGQEPKPQVNHVFVDLDSVKKDTEYELFFIKKEDGSRFFSPRLIRNIKLISDFGSYLGDKSEQDPFTDNGIWKDRLVHTYARQILVRMGAAIAEFYKETSRYREHELVGTLNKALLALMLANHTNGYSADHVKKNACEYFTDFLHYLHSALHTRSYQKMIAYPPRKANKVASALLNIIHASCRELYEPTRSYEGYLPYVKQLIEQGMSALSPEHQLRLSVYPTLSHHLAAHYQGLARLIKNHPNAPLVQLIHAFEEGRYHFFHPFDRDNLPRQAAPLLIEGKQVPQYILASPTYQEYINKAHVTEEFKAFLSQTNKGEEKRYLLFNFQDRTSWREYARAHTLEELSELSEFKEKVKIATLPVDTDFYHQSDVYYDQGDASQFIQQLADNTLDEHSGFYFSNENKHNFAGFANRAFTALHNLFFHHKATLTRAERLDFIELAYLFIELKWIETVKPDRVYWICKDGIDVAPMHAFLLSVFLKSIQEEHLDESRMLELESMIWSPSLINRERLPQTERFNRILSVIKLIEHTKEKMGLKPYALAVQEHLKPLLNHSIGSSL